VPTPARLPFTIDWLNAALMARRSAAGTVVDAARLQHITERKPCRDALSIDAERPGCDHIDLGTAETGASAAICDDRRVRAVADHLGRAILSAMLELGERCDIGDALPQRSRASWKTADFPQPSLSLRKSRRLCRGHQGQNTGSTGEQTKCESGPFHGKRAFTTDRFPIGNGIRGTCAQVNSLGSIAKLDEQKAQSTRITPSSPTIACRSSSGKRAITDRT
jgi:hypothetical protein